MRSLFVLTDESQALDEAVNFHGEELVVLVVVDKATLATSFDEKMDAMEEKARSLKQELTAKGRKCRVLVEWGDKTQAVANALQREHAQLINS